MNQTILIVDDDPVVRELVSEYLHGRGFKVATLENGLALQRRLQHERPALVVLDIMLARARKGERFFTVTDIGATGDRRIVGQPGLQTQFNVDQYVLRYIVAVSKKKRGTVGPLISVPLRCLVGRYLSHALF